MTTATLIPEAERFDFLPALFGERYMLAGEAALFDYARALSPDYDGGAWRFYRTGNGAYYATPNGPATFLTVRVAGNGYEGVMTTDAAGIVFTLFALSRVLSGAYKGSADSVITDTLIDHFHRLRDYAADHAERAEIFAAID